MLKRVISVFILALLIFSNVYSQDQNSKSLLILPFNLIGINEIPAITAKSILIRSLDKSQKYNTITEYQSNDKLQKKSCLQTSCAIEYGKQTNSDEVLVVEFASLGDVIIIQYILVDAKNDSLLLSEQTKAMNIEDLERVMSRMAISIETKRPILEGAEVGNIMASESEEDLHRNSSGYFGLAFGYLYPASGYDNDERSFSMDLKIGYDIEDYTVGLNFGARYGFFANLFGEYNFTKTDVCPYIGGGLGFHWVSHDNVYNYVSTHDGFETYTESEKLKTDGFSLNINAGMKFLRTYKSQLFANLAYELTFNDFDDKAFIFTIGILF